MPAKSLREPRRQIAALPWKRSAEGVEILLITSRETRRWVIPKGWPMKGKREPEAAAQEAYEEAGVFGSINPQPLGQFLYLKHFPKRRSQIVEVIVFSLEVTVERVAFPEDTQRDKRWCSPTEAATLVEEPDLQALILELGSSRLVGE